MKNLAAPGARRRFAFVLFFIFWLLKLFYGLVDLTTRYVPDYPGAVRGFPDIGQMGFYVVIPAAFAVLNMILIVLASRIPKGLALAVAALQVLLMPVLLFFSTGGV